MIERFWGSKFKSVIQICVRLTYVTMETKMFTFPQTIGICSTREGNHQAQH